MKFISIVEHFHGHFNDIVHVQERVMYHIFRVIHNIYNMQVSAIGPTTAEALANIGIKVDVTASKPNPESLLQAIELSLLEQAEKR